MKKLFLLMAVLFLLLSGTIFGSGQEESEVVSEEVPELFVWGLPSAYGNYTPEMLVEANEWAKEKFGCTFKIQSLAEGSTPTQGLNLLMAKGELPDVMRLGSITNIATKNLISKLYDDGKLAELDKFFNMPIELPTLAKSDMDYMSAYKYKGKIVAFPGYGASLGKDTPPSISNVWMNRFDIAKENRDNLPTSADELYDMLKKIKGNYVNINGEPIIPLGIYPDKNQSTLTTAIKHLKGAGWQSTADGKYVPEWASMEIYESLKFMNKLWSEGLMDAALWTLDKEKYKERLRTGSYGITMNGAWISAVPQEKIMSIVKEYGQDSKEARDYREKLYVIGSHPVNAENGTTSPVHTSLASPTVFSSAIDPLPMMKFYDYIFSDVGIIEYQVDAGEKDVDWEFIDSPYYWRVIGTQDSQASQALKLHKRGSWVQASQIDMNNLPKVVPTLMYFGTPADVSYFSRIYARNIDEAFASYGWILGAEEDFGFVSFSAIAEAYEQCEDYIVPTPSYKLFIPELEPLEESMLSTAKERWITGLPQVIVSDNFEEDYQDFISTLIKVGNQKPIYEKLQKSWEAWMENNGDDRSTFAGTATVIPQWKAVMGW